MKRLTITVFATLFMFFCVGGVYAEPIMLGGEQEEAVEQSICPFTKMGSESSCRDCHQVEKTADGFKWGVKEAEWRHAPYGVTFMTVDGEDTAYYLLESMNDTRLFDLYEYCAKYGIKHVWLEINSPGGSVVSAWRMIAFIQKYREQHGIHTTTECLGFAASAGFMMLVSGDHRIVSPRSMLMAHELWTLKFLAIETPAGSKDEAEDMNLWQNNINEWLAERSDLTTEEIAEHIHKRDWWMIGDEALKDGFVDELTWTTE